MRLELAPHDSLDEVTTVALVGDLDHQGAPELRQQVDSLIAAGAHMLLIDLSDATFIDSATLGVFVYAARRVVPLGGRFVVLCPDPGLRRLFALVGLDHMFPVAPDADAACGAFAVGG